MSHYADTCYHHSFNLGFVGMSYQIDTVADFAFSLSEANNFNDCFRLLRDAVQKMGFDGVLYMSIPVGLIQHKKKKPLTIFQASSTYNPTFLEHYAQENFAENDYTIKTTAAGKMDLIDWWSIAHNGRLDKEELNVFTVAREEYNLRNGLSVPMLSTPHEISGGSVVCCDNDKAYAQLIKNNSNRVQALIRLFHYRVHADIECKKVFINPLLNELNDKERMLLKFIASGKPLKVIDKYYDISPGYAKNMLATVCAKLGTDNVQELRYLLGIYQIIELV